MRVLSVSHSIQGRPNKKAQLTQGLRATAVRVCRHLGFLKFESCTISSAVPENPSLEPNMEWIGCTVCVTLKLGSGSLKVIESGTIR